LDIEEKKDPQLGAPGAVTTGRATPVKTKNAAHGGTKEENEVIKMRMGNRRLPRPRLVPDELPKKFLVPVKNLTNS